MSAPDGRHPPIDGLRALAAIAVLLTHAAIYSGLAAAGGDTGRVAQRLEVGVAVFFVISGFVLYRPFLLARLDGRELPRVGRYAGRRALRIVPAYWLALTVAAVALSLPGVFSLSGIVTYYGFGQIYATDTFTGGLVQAWTLCVEVTFYAFLPLWAWLMRRSGPAGLRRERWRCSAWRRSRWPGRRRSCGAARPTRSCCRRGCTRCPPTSTTSRSGWGSRCWSRGSRCRAGFRSPVSWWRSSRSTS